MIDRIRTYLTVVEEGSINRASARLRIAQPALSRQMKALEDQFGGSLLEREASGVKPTGLGHELIKSMKPLVAAFDTAVADLRRQARGERSELRIGYLNSAAESVLSPAIRELRKVHPEVTLQLHDMSPREQIDGLRAGELDLALIGQEGASAAREYHSTKLCSLGVCVAVSDRDPFATRDSIPLKSLRAHPFIAVDDAEMPGRNRWMTSLCRSAGFTPRFIITVDGITHVLSRIVSETAVTLLPEYFLQFRHPGVTFIPISDESARWDFIVLRQKGKAFAPALALIEAFREEAKRI
jgi:DNA-binding transcriptional LysR family regulator